MVLRWIVSMIQRMRCRHEYIGTNEEWSYFGKDHITYVCVKCGKRIY
jgi:hypothetical protein